MLTAVENSTKETWEILKGILLIIETEQKARRTDRSEGNKGGVDLAQLQEAEQTVK